MNFIYDKAFHRTAQMKKNIFAIGLLFLAPFALSQSQDDAGSGNHLTTKTFRLLNTAPKSAGEIQQLLGVARSTSAEMRANYHEAALSRLANPDEKAFAALAPTYEALLDDEDPDTRSAAARACAKLKDTNAVPKIRMRLKSLPKNNFDSDKGMGPEGGKEYRQALPAAEALSDLGDWDSVGEILDREVLSVSWEVVLPPFGARVVPLLREKSRSNRKAVRNGALRSISAIKDPAAVSALKSLLTENDVQVRNSAARALGAINTPEALSSVEGAYEHLDDWGKVRFLQACVKAWDNKKIMGYADAFLKKQGADSVKAEMVGTIGATGDVAAVQYLEELLKNQNETVRSEAACQLARLSGKLYTYSETNWTRLRETHCAAIQALKRK